MPEVGASSGRFIMESHDHDGNYVASLPYRNAQGEFLLGNRGSQFRCEIPHRHFPQVTAQNLYPGKHELWVYDKEIGLTDPIFAGPVWDITAGSDTGTLALSAQDPLTYLAKRLLKAFRAYTTQHATAMIDDLITYVNSVRAMNIITDIRTVNAQTSSPYYLGNDRNVIADLIDAIAKMDDGTDYYMRCVAGVHNLILYGGQIDPATAKSYVLDWGGNMDGYSVQYNSQTIANSFDERGANGVIQNAIDAAKQTEYDALFEAFEDTDQIITANILQTAVKNLKDTKSTKVIPSLVTHSITPIKDFDFGAQWEVVINDWYVQIDQLIRTVGWQFTIGQGDKTTTVIYSKDTEGVT